ncbi:hypothetical protein ACFQ7G_23500 [Streptomyces massasporeus]
MLRPICAAQRAPIPMPTARRVKGSTYHGLREARLAHEDRQRRVQRALADQRDPKRWRYTGSRTTSHAALWLLPRDERAPGPCRRITEQEEQRIRTVAASAADRVERAPGIGAQKRTLEQRCLCGGAIDGHGGEGRIPVAHCTGGGVIWTEQGAAA